MIVPSVTTSTPFSGASPPLVLTRIIPPGGELAPARRDALGRRLGHAPARAATWRSIAEALRPATATSLPPRSLLVVGLLAVEDALQRLEMPLRRGWPRIEAHPADIAPRALDDRGWEPLQRFTRPHRENL